jgi:hypothetical protein
MCIRTMPAADSYRQKAEECVARAKAAMSNEERARNYELAEQYMRLAMDELAPSKGRSESTSPSSAHSD